ncbi:MAG: phosphoglycerate dehydrogenase, partial [Clostridia bacterium]|nr:phosphoglycerate dehydrogenase [Clostridia bacterium]
MKVLVADPIAEAGIEVLKSSGDLEVDVRTGLSPGELADIIGQYSALVVRSETKVTREIIARADRMEIIARAGVGIDNIDVAAATEKGIIVVNAPEGNTIAAAEHTLAMMLALARNIPQANQLLKAGKWERKRFMGVELRNKVLGIVGLGRIGSEVAKRARG